MSEKSNMKRNHFMHKHENNNNKKHFHLHVCNFNIHTMALFVPLYENEKQPKKNERKIF